MKIQFDIRNRVVDIFVQKDEKCPVPFLSDNNMTAHEGLSVEYFRWVIKEKLLELDDLESGNFYKFGSDEKRPCPECGSKRYGYKLDDATILECYDCGHEEKVN